MGVLEQRTDSGVLWLTLNRPERKNAVSPELREELMAALDAAAADDGIRCLVITGAGDAFCAGVDLSKSSVTGGAARSEAPRDTASIKDAMKTGFQRVIRAVWEIEKPVIAAVNGVAAGGGAQLALACDLVVAAESARFIEIFVKRGLAVDSGGGWLLPRLVGVARAKELIFFGDPVSAPDAERLGLVNRVVADGELMKAVEDWAGRLARSATKAIGASKSLVNRAFESSLEAGFDDEATAQAMVSQTTDFAEGVRAFLEKRDPDFRGR